MPWVIFCSYETQDFEGLLQFHVILDYDSVNLQFTLTGWPQNEFVEQTIIDSDSQFIISVYLSIGKVLIDNKCKEVKDAYCVQCDFNDKRNSAVYKEQQYIIEKNGVIFVFDHYQEDNKIRLTKVKIVCKLGNLKTNLQRIPLHLFGEVAKTKRGANLIKQQKYFDQFVEDISNENCPTLQKRAALWAIGHIGRTKRGIRLINEVNLIDKLVRIAEKHECLSIRGTCIYVLNMLAFLKDGRQQLEKNHWIINLKTKTGWVCKPQIISQFYHINDSPDAIYKVQWPLQQQIWEQFYAFKQVVMLTAQQTRLIEYFVMLSNNLIAKEAKEEVKRIYKDQPDIFQNKNLVATILKLLTFYKYRADARKYIFLYLEKFLFSPNAFEIMDGTKCFNMHIV